MYTLNISDLEFYRNDPNDFDKNVVLRDLFYLFCYLIIIIIINLSLLLLQFDLIYIFKRKKTES